MNEERIKRSLKAIFSADVKGYSRLMGQDEVGTVSRLTEYRQVMVGHIERCGGKVVDSPGDNVLAEFTSVVDALECAVAVQRQLKKRNEPLPTDKKMAFRIGINLGDVIEDGSRIYGDGVNVAARIEGLAEPGGICISRTAHDAVGKKLPLGYAYLGAHEVKNIEKPVRVYRVLTEPEAAGKVFGEKRFSGRVSRRAAITTLIAFAIAVAGLIGWNIYLHQSRKVEAASLDRMAYPLPDKPSIAVLAFDNLSGDPSQEYISDGLTEEIITGLSKIPELFVIARNSSFTYKGKPVKVQQVSEELGVRYVLEGSVRKQDDRIRVTAQLIDAIKGYHIWSENYDRKLDDIFDLQNQLMLNIVFKLEEKLVHGDEPEWWNYLKKHENSYKFWETNRLVFYHLRQGPPEGWIRGRQLAQELVAGWPDSAIGYVWVGHFHLLDLRFGFSKSPSDSMKSAEEYAQKALQLDEDLGTTRSLLGWIYHVKGQHDLAIAEMERWVELMPSEASAHHQLGEILHYAGVFDRAVEQLELAIRLDPYPPAIFYSFLGAAHAGMIAYGPNNPDKAIEFCKKALEINPRDLIGYTVLTLICAYQDRTEDARRYAEELLRIAPNFTMKTAGITWEFKDKEALQPTLELWRKAGIPEG